MSDDYPVTKQTTGRVLAGGSAKGEIETAGARDWFGVTLVAGKTYRFDLEGSPTQKGVLRDPFLLGIHDANGNFIPGTANDDRRGGGDRSNLNSRVEFTVTKSGTYYVNAGAERDVWTGTYTLSVTDITPPGTPFFGSASYMFELADNIDGSTTAVSLGRVSATDPVKNAVTYSIVGDNAAGLFAIDAETGALTDTDPGENYEAMPSRELTVRASTAAFTLTSR